MKRWVVSLSGILLTLSVIAEEDNSESNIVKLAPLSLEELMRVEVVSIATGKPQTIAEAPAVTKVITEQDIESIGATELSEVLATVPGFHVARNGFLYSPIYTARGVYTGQYNPQVLFLINGSAVSTIYTGGRGFSQGTIPIKNIARIEIMKSPGAAIYGADAVAAVVNIITKQKTDILGTQVGGKVESFNTQNAWFLHSDRVGENDIAVSLELLQTAGDQSLIEKDAQSTLDKMVGTHASFAPSPVQRGNKTISSHLEVSRENWKLQTNTLLQRDLETGTGANQNIDPTGKFDSNQYLVDLTYRNDKLSPAWEVMAKATYFYFGFDNPSYQTIYPPGTKFSSNGYPNGALVFTGAAEYHNNLALDAFYKGWKNHLWRIGTGYQHANLYDIKQVMNIADNGQGVFVPIEGWIDVSKTPFVFTSTGIRNSRYFFVQDSYKFLEDWELTAGARYDKYSDFGSVVNPRLALVWQTNPYLTSKLIYGKAFRAPALFELYGRSNPVGLGNPNLQPERIQTGELALDYRPIPDLKIGLNLFVFRVEKGIGYMPSQEIITRAVASNAGEQTGKGFEIESRWKILKNVVLSGHYAFSDTNEKTPQATAGNIPHPKHSAYIRSDWSFTTHWYLNSQLNWTGVRKRGFNDPRADLKGYALFDLNLNYKPKNSWHISAGIKNLFDVSAKEPSPGPNSSGIIGIPADFPLAGRTFSIETHYHF
ncbi:MAG: hypothetical protein RIT27_803 [Pseudomonadota bacterium]|jgi:iron complex outermembrane receptor protein